MTARGGVVHRWRAWRLAPEHFDVLARVVVGALWLVIVTGAFVRLTASGLGCENWPRCGDTPFPETSFHPLVEFGNRMVALVAIILSIVLAVSARRTRGLGIRARWLAAGAAFGTLFQIPLGGITIMTGLHPVAVMSHFLLSIIVLAAITIVALDAYRLVRPRRQAPSPSAELRWLAIAAALLLPLGAVLIVTGTFVTAAGPHPGARLTEDGEVVRRIGDFWSVLRVHVYTSGVYGVAFVGFVAGLWRLRRELVLELRLAAGVLVVLVVQAVLGEIQKSHGLPWPLVLAHVSLAALAWTGIVAATVRTLEGAGGLSAWRPIHSRPSLTT